ncbi:MAG: hypothetical protein R3F59_24090 [Myxococcota bacterium]
MRSLGLFAALGLSGCFPLPGGTSSPSGTIPSTTTGPSTTLPTGTATGLVTESFVQGAPALDLLFVIDDSGSMANDQAELGLALPIFLDAIVGTAIDYHLGVITMDLDVVSAPGSRGELVEIGGERWVSPATVDPYGTLGQMAAVGTYGSSAEQGIGATWLALGDNADTVNAGFLRDGSALQLVYLTDERDGTPRSLITPAEFLDWIDQLGAPRPSLGVTAIVDADGLSPGVEYVDLANQVGGTVHDIDTVDYTLAMDLLGLEASSLARRFCLAAAPDPASVGVTVTEPDGTFVVLGAAEVAVDGVCVELSAYGPPEGSTVEVSYLPL